ERELGVSAPGLPKVDVHSPHCHELVEREPTAGADRWHEPRVKHPVAVDESVRLRWFPQGDDGGCESVVVGRQGGTELRTGFEARGSLSAVEQASDVHRTELLRIA